MTKQQVQTDHRVRPVILDAPKPLSRVELPDRGPEGVSDYLAAAIRDLQEASIKLADRLIAMRAAKVPHRSIHRHR